MPSYSWTEQYQAAVLEPDSEKMQDQATRAATLIERRKEELLREPLPNAAELQAIEKAVKVLALLREIANKQT